MIIAARRYLILLCCAFSISSFANETSLELTAENLPPAFQASYQLSRGSLDIGTLNVKLERISKQRWQYNSSTQAQGIASLFLGNKPVTDQTILDVNKNSVTPISFTHIQRKGDKDRSQYVTFDWQQKFARAQYKEKDNQLPLSENTFDNFSLQLLLMANINQLPNQFSLPVISKAKLKEFHFYKIGVQELETRYGTIEALLIERRKDDDKNSTYKIWAAPNASGLPLQIEKIENGKSQYLAKIIQSDLL